MELTELLSLRSHLREDTWCHAAFVRSSTATNGFSIYVNGSLSVQGTPAGQLLVNSRYSDNLEEIEATARKTQLWGIVRRY
jgi:hypothetical protein